ncbi:hypothetical protein [Streptomyces sp. NPDC094049]|uniref:hypothetical protein n=1 Tax=Streptomyces sp. NPDC094049 TaxID=3154987 RepID=UPI00332AEFD1
MTLTVTIQHLSETDELYRWYEGESGPQRAYVELSLTDGALLASCNGFIGKNRKPETVVHGIDRQWTIPVLTAQAANSFLDDLAPLAQRLLDGSAVEWDGKNHVGRVLTEDAQEADAEITRRCEALSEALSEDGGAADDLMDAWSIDTIGDTWSAEEAGITATTTDAELDETARRLLDEFRKGVGQPYAVIHGLDQHLRGLRDALAADQDT